MKNGTFTAGRPETKAKLRNFKLRKDVDEFLMSEAGQGGRTGKTATLYIEQALAFVMKLKPSVRDAEMQKALKEAA